MSSRYIDQFNINQAIFFGIERVISRVGILREKLFLLADGNYKLPFGIPYLSIPKGDDLVPSISAASILAKTARDNWMLRLEEKIPGYGFSEHKGYGTEKHRKALEELGLSRVHRLSFCKFLRKEGNEPTLFLEG